MKTIILSLATVLMFQFSAIANNDYGDKELVKSSAVSISLVNSELAEMIQVSEFLEQEEKFFIKFTKEVQMITFYNANGEVEMVIPVMSSEVNLGMSLFTGGNYTLDFSIN